MLRITDQATEHLLRVRREKGFDTESIPRFIRKAGRLALTWARKPKAGDRVVDGERVQTLVAESAADLLEGKTIDVKAAEGKALLIVRRRRADAEPRRATTRRTTRQAGATS